MNQKKGILSYIAKAFILILYLSFFIVQMLFNFDIGNSSTNTTLLPLHKNVASGHRLSDIKKTNTANDKKQTIRLNKRFKPQAIFVYIHFNIKPPVYCVETRSFVFHATEFIPASFLFQQSFRGPPVVA